MDSTENIEYTDPLVMSRFNLFHLLDEQTKNLGFEFTTQTVDSDLNRVSIDTEILDKFYKNYKYKGSLTDSIYLKKFFNFSLR